MCELTDLRSPLKAIRAFCTEQCMCGSLVEVRECPSTKCPLYNYRFGHKPKDESGKRVTMKQVKAARKAATESI